MQSDLRLTIGEELGILYLQGQLYHQGQLRWFILEPVVFQG